MTWIEPTVTCDAVRPAIVGIWVGIQDERTNLEQVGTAAFCVKGSGPIHRAFWELYPAPPHYFNLSVRPGDRMRARVRASGSNQFTLSVWNLTTGRSASTSARKNVRLVMAEWIVEAPASASTLRPYPLARFGPVKVIGASVTGDGVTTVIDDARWTLSRITMRKGGRTLATTSALTSNGRGFTVRWRHH